MREAVNAGGCQCERPLMRERSRLAEANSSVLIKDFESGLAKVNPYAKTTKMVRPYQSSLVFLRIIN